VIGWRVCEVLWRTSGNNIYERSDDVDLIYNTSDNSHAIEMLNKYNVEYIYIGTLERNEYTTDGLQKFDDYTDVYYLIYKNEDVAIYQLKGG
jgi:uncharacterized membrane protein